MVSRWTHPIGPTDSAQREGAQPAEGQRRPSEAWSPGPRLLFPDLLAVNARSWDTETRLYPDDLCDLGQLISLFWTSWMISIMTWGPSTSSSLGIPKGTSSAQGCAHLGEKAQSLLVKESYTDEGLSRCSLVGRLGPR